MAANCMKKALQSSSGSAKTLLSRSSTSSLASKASSLGGIPSSRKASTSRFSFQKLTPFRHPVELASFQSLMPLHSVTAAALYNSLLSLHNEAWGCLSEGAKKLLKSTTGNLLKSVTATPVSPSSDHPIQGGSDWPDLGLDSTSQGWSGPAS